MKEPVVAVALSGGVDSLVTGFLLKQKFKNVFGIHFTTGYESCPVQTGLLEEQLGFRVRQVDLSKEFENEVIRYFVETYMAGRTPNPCVICNRTIKFGALLEKAEELGADMLATGHYASIITDLEDQSEFSTYLKKGEDPKKDQSYFLSMLSREQLKKIVFPLAHLKKEQVKKIASDNGLAPLFPSESQDICFIHDNDFSNFIRTKLGRVPQNGDIVDLRGKKVGEHKGLHRYTIGQRRGLNCPASEPYYVCRIDMKNNRLVVCFKKDLTQSEFYVEEVNWNYFSSRKIDNVLVKIRYSHQGAKASLLFEENRVKVVFDSPQKAVTPGQVAVFYLNDRVLGAGIIH